MIAGEDRDARMLDRRRMLGLPGRKPLGHLFQPRQGAGRLGQHRLARAVAFAASRSGPGKSATIRRISARSLVGRFSSWNRGWSGHGRGSFWTSGFGVGIRLSRRDRLSYKRVISSGEAPPEKAEDRQIGSRADEHQHGREFSRAARHPASVDSSRHGGGTFSWLCPFSRDSPSASGCRNRLNGHPAPDRSRCSSGSARPRGAFPLAGLVVGLAGGLAYLDRGQDRSVRSVGGIACRGRDRRPDRRLARGRLGRLRRRAGCPRRPGPQAGGDEGQPYRQLRRARARSSRPASRRPPSAQL